MVRLIPEPLKEPLRAVKYGLEAQQQRGTRLLRYLKGQELWVRPTLRCRRRWLGRGDGRWCVCSDTLKPGARVYSFGVGNDISFDLALIGQFGVDVHAFDPTPLAADWLAQQTLPRRFCFHPYGLGARDGNATFSLPAAHGVSFTMINSADSKMTSRGEIRRLETIFATLEHERVALLKMDIEGTEYEVIPDLARLGGRIDQLLIEFHHRMFAEDGLEQTRHALRMLEEAGFALFNVSPRGLEYSFLYMN